MAEARVTMDFLALMLDMPEGTKITHVESVMEGDETYAQLRFEGGHVDFGPLDRVQLVYGRDEIGLDTLVSIDAISEAQETSADG